MKIRKYIIILVVTALIVSCTEKYPKKILFNHDDIQYSGRIEFSKVDSSAILYWPGNSVSIHFKGTEIKTLLKNGNDKNYFNVILDDSIFLFKADSIKRWYVLGSRLKDTIHKIEIFRRMTASPTLFYAFELDPEGEFLKTPEKKRSVEFYGNSITEGASIHDYTGQEPERWDSIYSDNYLTYGAITARHYDADYTCIARGGIGLMLSWYPMIMPEMYDRLNPDDPESKWDFSKKAPDIVVVNLFQNDAALVNRPEHIQFLARFGDKAPDSTFIVESYVNFLKKIRKHYTKASIICTLGSMTATRKDLPWRGYVNDAVLHMNDKKIYTHFFSYKGGYMHPKVEEHQKMANSLIQFVDKNIKWNK